MTDIGMAYIVELKPEVCNSEALNELPLGIKCSAGLNFISHFILNIMHSPSSLLHFPVCYPLFSFSCLTCCSLFKPLSLRTGSQTLTTI